MIPYHSSDPSSSCKHGFSGSAVGRDSFIAISEADNPAVWYFIEFLLVDGDGNNAHMHVSIAREEKRGGKFLALALRPSPGWLIRAEIHCKAFPKPLWLLLIELVVEVRMCLSTFSVMRMKCCIPCSFRTTLLRNCLPFETVLKDSGGTELLTNRCKAVRIGYAKFSM